MSAIVKNVIKSLEIERIIIILGSIPYNNSGWPNTLLVSNIVYVGVCECDHMPFPSRPVNLCNRTKTSPYLFHINDASINGTADKVTRSIISYFRP